MRAKLIILLIVIVAIVGVTAIAKETDRVIELYKGGELIYKYNVTELDSVKFDTIKPDEEYKYIVSAVSSPKTKGIVTINGSTNIQYIPKGGTATFTAIPDSGFLFRSWSVSGIEISTSTTYTITISSDINLIASFEKHTTQTGTNNGYDYVDLGLSVKWATCNVGANSPEEYGDYFAWGETTTVSFNYKYFNYNDSGDLDEITKYCVNSEYGTVDNRTILELSDDATRSNWGGSWRMPTKAEQDELRENCSFIWGTTQNGVTGVKLISKKNGNSIFLPAAGSLAYWRHPAYEDMAIYDYVGIQGEYWSSSLVIATNPYQPSTLEAHVIQFGKDFVSESFKTRSVGLSIRPVCE